MAMLHELIRPGVPAKLKKGQDRFTWDGEDLRSSLCTRISCKQLLFHVDWELDEPTVEDVLKERGYRFVDEWGNSRGTWISKKDICILWLKSKPETAAKMTRIIDFLESLTPPKTGG